MRLKFVCGSLYFEFFAFILLLDEIKMNINTFIKSHKEFEDLPFLVVFRTLQILQGMGMLKFTKENKNVDKLES